MADGWLRFEAAEYQHAIEIFHVLVESDADPAEAYSGLGWSFALSDLLDSAIIYFGRSIRVDSSQAASWAGLGVVHLARYNYQASASSVEIALSLDPRWHFEHMVGVDEQDLHLALAQSYFGLGLPYYESVQREIDYLDPANGLAPDDPGSWRGQKTYALALIVILEELETRIGAHLIVD